MPLTSTSASSKVSNRNGLPLGWIGLGCLLLIPVCVAVVLIVDPSGMLRLVLDNLLPLLLLVVGLVISVIGVLMKRNPVPSMLGTVLGLAMLGLLGLMSAIRFDSRVSQAHYDQIEIGMPIQDIEAMLGRGERVGGMNVENATLEWRSDSLWGNKSIVVFTMEGKVTDKSHFGLE